MYILKKGMLQKMRVYTQSRNTTATFDNKNIKIRIDIQIELKVKTTQDHKRILVHQPLLCMSQDRL